MPMHRIYFIDPRGNYHLNDTDVHSRHVKYLTRYREVFSEELEIEIIGIENQDSTDGITSTRIMHKTRNSLLFALRAFFKLRNQDKCVFVVADPWFSFLTSRILTFIRNSDDAIQLQLHGQYFREGDSLIRKYLVTKYITKCIEIATETRFVNENEFNRFLKIHPKAAKKMFLSPVPINPVYTETTFSPRTSRPVVLGFIGRLHEERGLSEFVRLAILLKDGFPELRLLIIGSGERTRAMEAQLLEEFGKDFEFTGYLEPQELRNKLNEIGVLASCAPSESYGRAMREAIMSGVPVLATPSDGANMLRKALPPQCIEIIDFKLDSKAKILRKFEFLLNSHFSSVDVNGKLGLELESGSKLVESWNRLLTLKRIEK